MSTAHTAAIVLAVVAIAEVGVFAWQRARTDALLGRMADVHTIAAMGLDSDLSLLILVDEEEAGLHFDELRHTQRAGAAWLDAYVTDSGIPANKAALLREVLSKYLADYAGARVTETVRAHDSRARPGDIAQTERFFRTVDHILGGQEGAAFKDAVTQAWGGWVP